MPPVDDIPPIEVVPVPPALDAPLVVVPLVPLTVEGPAVVLDEPAAVLDELAAVLDELAAVDEPVKAPDVVDASALPSPGAGSPLSVPHAAKDRLKKARAPADTPRVIRTRAGHADAVVSITWDRSILMQVAPRG